MTLTMSLTCDHACEDAGLDTIAMDTPLHRDPNNPLLPYPFRPGHYPTMSPRELRSDWVDKLPRSLPTWQLFTSRVKTPSRWLINCPQPSNKMTNIPMQYRLPTLPKGWRYKDNAGEVKWELLDELAMMVLDHPATTQRAVGSVGSKHQSSYRRTLRSMRGTRRYPSPSPTSLGAQHPQDTSRSI